MGRIGGFGLKSSGITMIEVTISILLLSVVSAGVYKTCIEAETTSINATNSLKAVIAFDGYIESRLLSGSNLGYDVRSIPGASITKNCYIATCNAAELKSFASVNLRDRLLASRIGINVYDVNQPHYGNSLTLYWSLASLGQNGSFFFHPAAQCSTNTYHHKWYLGSTWGTESPLPSAFTPYDADAQEFHTTRRPFSCITFIN